MLGLFKKKKEENQAADGAPVESGEDSSEQKPKVDTSIEVSENASSDIIKIKTELEKLKASQ